MSLTRKEYEEIFQLTKSIERLADYLYMTNKLRALQIQTAAKNIRDIIESVIGQQE